jgi:hypothetical protein
VRISVVTESEHFTEVDGSQESSVRVVPPHAVSKLVSPRSYVPGLENYANKPVAATRASLCAGCLEKPARSFGHAARFTASS